MGSKNFFFFVDADKQASGVVNYVAAQGAGDPLYGPVTTGAAPGMDEYRVTSLHSATFNPTAYAMCDATVCVQKIPGTTPPLVNIVLKPLVQPALNFAPIKYIVYKGILASSLIAANGLDVAAAASNQLTQLAWAVQARKNAAVSPNPPATAPAAALGIGLTGSNFADSDPIDNLFYRTGVSFQLPNVDGGWTVGQFDKTKFGIEVLMEGLNFHHTLKLVRQLENRISVPTLAAAANGAQKFDHWHAKEQILGFMDPCAFYGSFFKAGVLAKKNAGTTFVPKPGNDLYTDVLFPFHNRNRVYLDIRNEHNFSFDYFGNYNGIVRLGNPPGLVDYYRDNWPILAVTAADLPAANTAKARTAIQLQLAEGDNAKPLIYISQGYRELHVKGNGFPGELKSAERFFDAFLPFGSGYTTPKGASGQDALTFAIPNVTGQQATTPAASYIRLKYLKQRGATVASAAPTVIPSGNYLDNLIWPSDLYIPLSATAPIRSAVYDEEIYIDAQDEAGLHFDAIASVGMASDSDNISLFLLPTAVRKRKGLAAKLVALSGEAADFAGHYPNFVALKYPREIVTAGSVKLSATATVPVADFASDSWIGKFAAPDFDRVLMIVIANATWNGWKTKIASGGVIDKRFRTYLGIKNPQRRTDLAGIAYTSLELVLRGYALNANGNNYEVREVSSGAGSGPNITVYANAGS